MLWLGGLAEPTSALTLMSTSTPYCVHDWQLERVLMWLLQLSGEPITIVISLGGCDASAQCWGLDTCCMSQIQSGSSLWVAPVNTHCTS